MKYPVPKIIKEFSDVFEKNGFKLYIVGGAVRDYLLHIDNHDYDFCTDAKPNEVISIFKHVIPTGIKHGTVTVLFKGQSYEVTTFRTETSYSDSRHPDNVSFVRDLYEDLSRRDFTINAFASDCQNGEIIDHFDGLSDLKKGIVRAIGDPIKRFEEDALRMMRLARFCAKLDFSASLETENAAIKLSNNIRFVSNERIFDELSKTLMSKNPLKGLFLLQSCNILFKIIPELRDCLETNQDKISAKNVLEHSYLAVDIACKYNYPLEVRLACLLHDIAKPMCMKINENNTISFHRHEFLGSKLTYAILKRLKCSNSLIGNVCTLIENHMIIYNKSWSDGAVKRFIKRVGFDNIENLFSLQWCDQMSSGYAVKHDEYDEFRERINLLSNEPLSIKDLKINGNDLFALGVPKSNLMGKILERLLDMVLDDSSLNEKTILQDLALKMFKEDLTL